MSRPLTRLGILALSATLAACASTPENAATPPAPQAQQQAPNPAATIALDVSSQLKVAELKRAQGDYGDAVRILAQLMLAAPDDPHVVGEYGKVLVQQGRTNDAVAFLNRALELAPGDWTLYSALGIAYDQAKNYKSARVSYERALELKPGEAVVLNNFAMSRMLAGDLAQARQLIAQASGSNDPRVAKNAALIAELSEKSPPVAAAAPEPARHAPKPMVASAPAKSEATAAPKKLAPAPVKTAEAHKPAKTEAKPEEVAKAKPKKPETSVADQIPALRLANDRL